MQADNNQYYRGYRVKIYPTAEQAAFIDRCIELNRYVYNWALEQELNQYDDFVNGKSESKFISKFTLDKMFTKLRSENEWLKEIPYTSARNGIKRLTKAFKRFFAGISNIPRFKSKKNYKSLSYQTREDRMFFEDNMLRIEGLPKDDMIYTKYHTGFKKSDNIKYKDTVISKDNLNNYWITFCLLVPKPIGYFNDNNIPKMDKAIGIDLNVKKRFVLSTGQIYYGPDISRKMSKISKLERSIKNDRKRRKKLERINLTDYIPISRRSANRIKKYKKLYKKIHNITENFIQTTTKRIIDMNPKAIVMENLSVEKMKEKHYIAKQVHFANFYRCREVMEYKCNIYNIPFILAEKDYPSSQLCSRCKNRQNIGPNKIYFCNNCGLEIDRDFNAALNLEMLAY